jgi:hypothetical protein
MSKDAADAVLDNLATYLAAQVPGLTVRKEWPSANQALVYPSLTIFSGQVTYTPLQPYETARTAPDVNNQVVSTLVVGEWDGKLQLDLWCRNKVERQNIGKQVRDAINKQVNPQGLSLQMADYFNEWVRFDVDSYNQVDEEAGVQRQEFRTKLSLLFNVKEVAQKTDFGMITIIDTQTTTTDTITG